MNDLMHDVIFFETFPTEKHHTSPKLAFQIGKCQNNTIYHVG